MPVNDSRRLLTTAEAADYLRIGKSTLRKYVRNGSVHAIRLGEKPLIRFDPEDLEAFKRRGDTVRIIGTQLVSEMHWRTI